MEDNRKFQNSLVTSRTTNVNLQNSTYCPVLSFKILSSAHTVSKLKILRSAHTESKLKILRSIHTVLTFKTLRSAHTVYLCVVYGSENKQRLFRHLFFAWFL